MPTNRKTERDVTFQVESRPIRLAYIIRHNADLTDAISLYTHLWGGAANWILPLPDEQDDELLQQFFTALENFDPDYIFVPEEINPRRTKAGAVPPVIHELKRRNYARMESIDSVGV